MVNLLVVVGALAVLFLFVIMLLEIPATELRAFHRGWSLLFLQACVLNLFEEDSSHGQPGMVSDEGGSSRPYGSVLMVMAGEPICSASRVLFLPWP